MRIAEADCLHANGHYDLAYYCSGYAIELLLKARICKILDIPNFFDFGVRTKFPNEDSITKPYKVHNFEQLLILSGLYAQHKADWSVLVTDWSILSTWNENFRYKSGKQSNEVDEYIKLVKKFKTWISPYL